MQLGAQLAFRRVHAAQAFFALGQRDHALADEQLPERLAEEVRAHEHRRALLEPDQLLHWRALEEQRSRGAPAVQLAQHLGELGVAKVAAHQRRAAEADLAVGLHRLHLGQVAERGQIFRMRLEASPLPALALGGRVGDLALLQAQRLAADGHQLRGLERLLQEPHRRRDLLHLRLHLGGIVDAAHDHDGDAPALAGAAELVRQLEAVAPGQHRVEHDQIDAPLREGGARPLAVVLGEDGEAALVQRLGEGALHAAVVLDEEDGELLLVHDSTRKKAARTSEVAR